MMMRHGTGVALIVASGLLSAFSPAHAQSSCEWYARTALKQQQTNERLKCDLKGASWSSDFKAHLAWCGTVGPDDWKAEARKRDQQLAACARK